MAIERLYTLNEVCNLARRTKRTIYNDLKRGTLKAFKMEGSTEWRVKEAEVERYLNGR